MPVTSAQIKSRLLEMQDIPYKKFQSALIPNLPEERFIGVRTPALKAFAGELLLAHKQENSGFLNGFLSELPHHYFDEDQLHAFVVSGQKDFDACVGALEEFLPYINNWATCDQLNPKIFKKNKEKLLPFIKKWILSEHVYTVRFAISMLMKHFLNDDFSEEYLEMVCAVKNGDYYVKMMVAWYFATALAMQYDSALPYIEQKKLEPWTHNKAIQKACESFRVKDELKEYLRTLKNKL